MKYRAEITTKEQLAAALAISAFEYVYAPMEFVGNAFMRSRTERMNPFPTEPSRIILVPPVFLGGNETLIAGELQKLKQAGFKGALAHTLGHIELIKSAGLNAHGGFRLNITNSLALKQYEELGLVDGIFSLELNFKSMAKIEHEIPVGIIAYGYMPLILTRRCPVKSSKHCGKSGCNVLTDRLGNKFRTACRFGESEILNPVPLVAGDFAADFTVLRFSAGEKMTLNPEPKNFTRGLYNKKVR
jgi:putative protease